jgi:biotin carboxyl carrier protein
MKKYRIYLNGNVYEMEIELLNDTTPHPLLLAQEYKGFSGVKADTNVNVIDPALQKPTINNPGIVKSSVPGTVVSIEKPLGATVKAGDLVLLLEAMKMENEILAPKDGVVTKMNCKVGATVAGGEFLFEVE